jgi:hypothetical protein
VDDIQHGCPSGFHFFCSLGLALALLSQAHILWLPGLLPFLAYRLYQRREFKGAAMAFGIFSLVLVFFSLYRQGLSRYHISPRFNPLDVLLHQIARMPQFIYTTAHGRHELWFRGEPNIFGHIFALLFVIAVLFLMITGLVFLFTGPRRKLLFIAASASLGFTAILSIFTFHIQGKYLLPLVPYGFFALYIFLSQLATLRSVYVGLAMYLVVAVLASVTLKPFFGFETRKADLTATISYLEANRVPFVYCTHGMLAWQLIFYSDERVIARHYKYEGRYKPYGQRIDSAFRNGGKVAVVGYTDTSYNEMLYPDGHKEGGLFTFIAPPGERLEKQFEFIPGQLYPIY